MDLQDLNFKIGDPNMSGINDVIYFVQKSKVTSFPTIADTMDNAESIDEYTEYSGDFVFADGTKCLKLYNTEGKGKVTFEATGDLDVMEFVNKATFQFPKIDNESRAFAKRALNDDIIFFVRHDGKWYVIGDQFYRVKTTITGDSGDGAGSKTGLTINLEVRSFTPLPTYAGELPVTGGNYDCATDTFTPANGQ